jgi:hypothetical protein
MSLIGGASPAERPPARRDETQANRGPTHAFVAARIAATARHHDRD